MWFCLVHTSLVCLLIISASSATTNKQKSHILNQNDLSDSPHEVDGSHNPRYDQEAVFGKRSKRLEELSPEDGLNKLRAVFRKMDGDHDGYVTQDELRVWLRKVQDELGLVDAKYVWEEHDLAPNENLTWHAYSNQAVEKDGIYGDEDKLEQDLHLARDKVRWALADSDNDGALNMNEAIVFFNPESFPQMQDILVQETIDDMDTNKDGFIDVDEYIADIWQPSAEEPNEPDWVSSEREDFAKLRDLNKDGKLDREEIRHWRFLSSPNAIEQEMEHLFQHCDLDRDMRLTEEEVVLQYDLFVGSVATNYGQVLVNHDEL